MADDFVPELIAAGMNCQPPPIDIGYLVRKNRVDQEKAAKNDPTIVVQASSEYCPSWEKNFIPRAIVAGFPYGVGWSECTTLTFAQKAEHFI